jgi:ankyrin repeat protein
MEACRKSHERIVDVLLERGAVSLRHWSAPEHSPLIVSILHLSIINEVTLTLRSDQQDPNYRGCGANALASAAAGGSIAIVRKLLDHGVDISGTKLYEPLRRAIKIEHTEIIRLFLRLIPDLRSGRCGYSYLVKFAVSQGLDSMVELLEREVPPSPTA